VATFLLDGTLIFMRRVVIGETALALLIASGSFASGAQPVETARFHPAPGEAVHRTPRQVELGFDKALQSSSKLTVFDACGNKVSGRTLVSGSKMRAPIGAETSGHYSVRYSIHAAGNSPIGGSYSFHVESGHKCKEHGHDSSGKDRGKLLKADRGSFLTERLGPLMSLVLVLLVPALVGLVAGFRLRRRDDSG
jgi:methionine-rich copper-binding protein CopC